MFTPLKVAQWDHMLAQHPDRQYVAYLLSGIQEGFRIGYERREHVLGSARKNMKTAMENPQVIKEYLDVERKRGVLLGPFERSEMPEVHLSRFGVIPKSNQPGKWRLIVDLSHPEGRSVNDVISGELCSLQYMRIEEVVRRLLKLGPGAQMAKMDIKSAYRMVPVHPQDRVLLGVQWEGQVYVDAALPFGLRSAPKVFNALADGLEWIVKDHGAEWLWHYLDDFITCGAADSDECQLNLQMLLDICNHLGVPIAQEKVEGPSTCIVFLGILIDTTQGELRLPQDKLARLRARVEEWLQKKRCAKRDLLSLAGQLQHAATVVRSGRAFIRRLFDLSTTARKPHHHLSLNKGVRSDLAWWHEFLTDWNGVSLLVALGEQEPTIILTSDASGRWGCGAFWELGWFQLAWSATACTEEVNIATKELIPIVLAAAMWGKAWEGQVVCCRCDNEAVVAVLNRRTCRDQDLMHLLRCLSFFEAMFSFRAIASHISGAQNCLADDLSRNKLPSFLQAVGQATLSRQFKPPQPLLDMLVNVKPDWTSQVWRRMFSDTLKEV